MELDPQTMKSESTYKLLIGCVCRGRSRGSPRWAPTG
jgi:hypothetical protein